jgi:hypothetical protein
MRIVKKSRTFKPGPGIAPIKECAKIQLVKNEQVVFLSYGSKYDFCKTNWGFYASPSINGRLKNEGFKCFIITNKNKKKYFVVVNKSKISKFREFLKDTKHVISNKL